MRNRQGRNKSGALSRRAFGSNRAAVIQDNFSGNGQPHSCAFVFVARVQPLKDIKNAVQIFFIEPNAVVAYDQFA